LTRGTDWAHLGRERSGEFIMYLSPFGFAIPRRALAQLLGRPQRGVHEMPVDHLPPLGATVTPLAARRRERDILRTHTTRSG